MLKGLIKAIDIIDKEQECIEKSNPVMYLGMERVKTLIKLQIKEEIEAEINQDILNTREL